MTSKTIDTLDAASALASGDKFPLAASGSDTLKRATVSQLQTYMQANLSFGVEVLTADRTYYVRTDGSDSNTGLANTAGGAFLTIQKALNVVSAICPGAYYVTIQVADGDYSGAGSVAFISALYPNSNPRLTIQGNDTNPENVVIGSVFIGCGGVNISGFSHPNTGLGFELSVSGKGAYLVVGVFNPDPQGAFSANGGGVIMINGPIIYQDPGFSVNPDMLLNASIGGCIIANGTIDLNANVSFNVACAWAWDMGIIRCSNTWGGTGTATGARYLANKLSLIDVDGAGGNVFPGTVAGSATNGGVYV